jgi:glucokinase
VEQGFREAMGRVSAMLRSQIEQTSAKLMGIGIGCTGPVDPFTGRLEDVNTLPGWEGSDPVRVLSSNFEVSVAMENDADAAALAEAHWGSGKGKARFMCITVGTGIGSGLILDPARRMAEDPARRAGRHERSFVQPVCHHGQDEVSRSRLSLRTP